MAWEALNNIAAAKDRPLVIVVNDNERSYAPTIGGLANHLATLRTTDGYERFLARTKEVLERTPVVGRPLYDTLHGAKKGLKDFIAPQGMFEDLGLKYVGPIDGHDLEALESALTRAKRFGGPVIVHCLTEKGRGYQPALQDEADRFHAVGKIHPDTPACPSPPPAPTGPASSATRCSNSARSATTSSPSRPRCSSRSASTSSPRPSRTASTTSASPSSTALSPRPASPTAASTRFSPCTPPSSTAPSTRC
ncbi:1-deoxy-D-xylulose-5-phosphate synthase [Streptomyces tendae]